MCFDFPKGNLVVLFPAAEYLRESTQSAPTQSFHGGFAVRPYGYFPFFCKFMSYEQGHYLRFICTAYIDVHDDLDVDHALVGVEYNGACCFDFSIAKEERRDGVGFCPGAIRVRCVEVDVFQCSQGGWLRDPLLVPFRWDRVPVSDLGDLSRECVSGDNVVMIRARYDQGSRLDFVGSAFN